MAKPTTRCCLPHCLYWLYRPESSAGQSRHQQIGVPSTGHQYRRVRKNCQVCMKGRSSLYVLTNWKTAVWTISSSPVWMAWKASRMPSTQYIRASSYASCIWCAIARASCHGRSAVREWKAHLSDNKEDYITFMPKPNVKTALHNLAVAIEHYNENHPHSALGYLSPREYRRQWITST